MRKKGVQKHVIAKEQISPQCRATAKLPSGISRRALDAGRSVAVTVRIFKQQIVTVVQGFSAGMRNETQSKKKKPELPPQPHCCRCMRSKLLTSPFQVSLVSVSAVNISLNARARCLQSCLRSNDILNCKRELELGDVEDGASSLPSAFAPAQSPHGVVCVRDWNKLSRHSGGKWNVKAGVCGMECKPHDTADAVVEPVPQLQNIADN